MRTPTLATLRLRVPAGTQVAYDVAGDQWILATASERAIVTAAPRAAVASPEAFRHAVARSATIVTRESLSDGFAVTLESSSARMTYVVKELGSAWIVCGGAFALCKSLKRG